jgi:arsenate reductase
MDKDPIIVFVCEHGAAKSVVAAAYFNHFAAQMELGRHAVARGTNPDHELSPQTVKGLSEDGLTATESVPQKLTQADIESAQRVVTFCELPAEYQQPAILERWGLIPPVSENYEKARDAIIERIRQMLDH